MARRRKSFGLVKHKQAKMADRYYARDHKGLDQARHSFGVTVYYQRGSRPTNASRLHGFWAHACMGGKGVRARFKKCGPAEFGRTPTVAAKKALVALGRSSEVR